MIKGDGIGGPYGCEFDGRLVGVGLGCQLVEGRPVLQLRSVFPAVLL